jgi:hypothetical protein
MTKHVVSDSSAGSQLPAERAHGWLKVGVIAAASVLAGGLAAAWWYRETLTKLHQTEAGPANPEFGTSVYEPADES